MIKGFTLLVIAFWLSLAHSADICESSNGIKTPYGKFTKTHCSDDANSDKNREWVSLNEIKILQDRRLIVESFNKVKGIFIYNSSDLNDYQIGCDQGLYLIDLSFTPPKVIQFGVKNACNEFDWASWGDKGSVIALKKDVRFTYKDGKIIPPKDMEHMWSSMVIPVPRGKTSADQPYPNYIIPYAKEIPLPQK